MSELKHTLKAGRMNKDLDERLVLEGEYRDATNIEVSTSEGSNAGVVQTLMGNTKKDSMALLNGVTGVYDLPSTYSGTCVCSVSSPSADVIYYFVNRDTNTSNGAELDTGKDYIMEYNTITEKLKYVFVDIHRVKTTVHAETTTVNNFLIALGAGVTTNQTGVRIGMKISVGDYTGSDNIKVTDILYDTASSKWKITVDTDISISASAAIKFSAPRVLKFNKNTIITGVNILDDFIFWTDNQNEPKKIHIKRSMLGTGGTEYLSGAGNLGVSSLLNYANNSTFHGENAHFHTRLVKDYITPKNLKVATDSTGKQAIYVEESNITVIKESPSTQLHLDMFTTGSSRINTSTGIENPTSCIATGVFTQEVEVGITTESQPVSIGSSVALTIDQPLVDFRNGDIIILAATSGYLASDQDSFAENTTDIRAKVTSGGTVGIGGAPNNLSPVIGIEVLSIKEGVSSSNTEWRCRLEDKDPLFNFKFPRFSYRYKYQDGEYSTFAPWSEVAFLPGYFDYQAKKGHNLGMVNNMRSLKIKGYHPQALPKDVVEIDILYKETNNPTVYTVKTITPADEHPLWPNQTAAWNSIVGIFEDDGARGDFTLDTDMIHSIVPANQLIRPWDNVPKKALAQEISGNRLIYGNYVQGYDITHPPLPILTHDFKEISYQSTSTKPKTSVKTLRDYQVGVVFSDRYGRETPVLTNDKSALRIPKKYSYFQNKLKVKLDSNIPVPEWAEYYSYYVKESSVEYYSLSMDRWYEASDGNIWISFPSAERNKLTDESFLILKKGHASEKIVTEKARYKVLSIKSEAPDFIKTKRLTLGKLYNTDNSAIGTSGFGFPLPGYKNISIQQEQFETVFGDQMHIDQPSRLFLRIWRGGASTSKFYRVSKVAAKTQTATDTGGTVRLEMIEPFGEDMAFTSTNDSFATAVDGLALELVEDVVENRPEFDGRFFVKIFKDDVLSNYVAQTVGIDYFVEGAFPIGYINNNGYVNAGTRTMHPPVIPIADPQYAGVSPGYLGVVPYNAMEPLNPWLPGTGSTQENAEQWTQYGTAPGPGGGVGTAFNQGWWRHYTSYKYTHGRVHPTEHDWSGLNNYNAGAHATGKPYKWLNDDADVLDGHGEMMELNAVMALNAGTFGVSGMTFSNPAMQYWHHIKEKKRFFIDACTAYSWNPGVDRAVPGNRYGSNSLNGIQFTHKMGDDASLTGQFSGSIANVANQYGWQSQNHPGNFTWGNQGIRAREWVTDTLQGNNFSSEGSVTNAAQPYVPPGSLPQPFQEAGYYSHKTIASNFYSEVIQAADDNAYSGLYNGADWKIVSQSQTGTPSRGIWTTTSGYCAMDLSWNSWDAGNYGWSVPSTVTSADAGTSIHHLQSHPPGVDPDGANDAAWEFIQKLVQPGVSFRFQKDPDQTVYSVLPYTMPYVSDGYDNSRFYSQPTGVEDGLWGIRNVGWTESSGMQVYDGSSTVEEIDQFKRQYLFAEWNIRQRWTILVVPAIGSGPSGYNPIHGTDPEVITDVSDTDFRRALQHDGEGLGDAIEIINTYSDTKTNYSSKPGMWETEPKEAVDLDIYYQASHLIPININARNCEEYIQIGSCFYSSGYMSTGGVDVVGEVEQFVYGERKHTITSVSGDGVIAFTPGLPYTTESASDTAYLQAPYPGAMADGTFGFIETSLDIDLLIGGTTAVVIGSDASPNDLTITLKTTDTHKQNQTLAWNNCWCFGNGVESDRIRDDFNAPQMDNGVKASATLGNEKIKEEHKKYGMIWSGIYNSNSGVNNTNQFIAGEAITKDINPTHGSIQVLSGGDTLLRIFCEDKVLKSQVNKDILFNADGNQQVVASNKVVGAVTAYQGDYGISTNPESLVTTPYADYFVDANRGKVLIRTGEGVRPISEVGMKDYFADTMKSYVTKIIGTYDARKNEYNVSINKQYEDHQLALTEQITASYNEGSKGWSSLKSFYKTISATPARVQGLEQGLSLNNKYYTFLDGHIWQHHSNDLRNNFYGQQYTSDVTVLFNDMSGAVKSFNTVNYEGSQAKVTNWDDATVGVDNVGFYNNDSSTGSGATVGTTTVSNVSDGEYFNIGATIAGWYVDSIETNLQSCGTLEFKDKEGKWFAYPTGKATVLNNLDEKEFSVQGLGVAAMTHSSSGLGEQITITVNNSSTSSGGASWD